MWPRGRANTKGALAYSDRNSGGKRKRKRTHTHTMKKATKKAADLELIPTAVEKVVSDAATYCANVHDTANDQCKAIRTDAGQRIADRIADAIANVRKIAPNLSPADVVRAIREGFRKRDPQTGAPLKDSKGGPLYVIPSKEITRGVDKFRESSANVHADGTVGEWMGEQDGKLRKHAPRFLSIKDAAAKVNEILDKVRPADRAAVIAAISEQVNVEGK